MKPQTLAAAVVVIAASMAFVLVGNHYNWQLTSAGYAKWTRVTGVVAVLAIAGMAAWSRIAEPLLAITILVGGVALSVGYVILHRRLTEQVRAQLSRDDASR